jgi:hypothetical protein
MVDGGVGELGAPEALVRVCCSAFRPSVPGLLGLHE